MRHLDLLRRVSFKDNWMNELGSEVTYWRGSEDSQQTQPKIKNPFVSTGRPVESEQPSGSLTQEIDKGVLFGCESNNVKHGETCEELCQCMLNVKIKTKTQTKTLTQIKEAR